MTRKSGPWPFRFRHLSVLAAILLGSVLLRLPHLSADPPDNLSSSRAIYNDGGTYALNARSRLVEGKWIAPGDNVIAQTPGFTLIAYGAFRLMGLGLVPLRVVSIIGTVAALLVILLVSLREWGPKTAILTAMLLGCNFTFIMYGRLELIEGILTGVGAVGMAALMQARRPVGGEAIVGSGSPGWHGVAWTALGALLLFSAVMIKPTAAILMAPALLFLLLSSSSRPAGAAAGPDSGLPDSGSPDSRLPERRLPKWLIGDRGGRVSAVTFALVTGLLLLLYRVFFYAPHQLLFEQYHLAFQQNASGLWDRRPPVVWFQALSVLGIWGPAGVPFAALCTAGVAAAVEERDDWAVLLSLWLVTGLLYLAPQTYRPGRFTVLIIPPAAALAARGAVWLWKKPGRVNSAAALCWLIYLAAAAFMKLTYPVAAVLHADVAITLFGAALIACGVFGRRLGRMGAGRRISAALVAAALIADVVPYGEWVASPHYSLRDAGASVAALGGDSALAGDNWVEALALFHRIPTYKIDWLAVPESDLRAWHVRYLIFDAHETRVPQLYGALLRRAVLAQRLRVGHHTILVEEIQNP